MHVQHADIKNEGNPIKSEPAAFPKLSTGLSS